MPKSERLATVDAAWLNMDAPHNRMVITAVIELGDVVDPERFSKLIEQRLVVRYPRFRQRIDTGSLGEHRWVEDEQFDLRAHVHRIGLPRPRGGADGGEGAREALQELVSQLIGIRLATCSITYELGDELASRRLGGARNAFTHV